MSHRREDQKNGRKRFISNTRKLKKNKNTSRRVSEKEKWNDCRKKTTRRLINLDETIIEFLSQSSDKVSPFTSQIISIDDIINIWVFLNVFCACVCVYKKI